MERLFQYQRHQYRKRRCDQYYNRSVDSCKFRDEFFLFTFLAGCIFHQIQNLRHCRIFKILRNFRIQNLVHHDVSRQKLFAFCDSNWNTFSSQRLRVNHRASIYYHAVQRNFLSRFDYDNISHIHIVRIHLIVTIFRFQIRKSRCNVHQFLDRITRFPNGLVLENLPDLIKKHNSNTFGVFSNEKRTQSCNHHQEMFVK